MSKKLKRFLNRRKQQKPFTAWPKEFQIGDNDKPLLATMTGEPFQLSRIHYTISNAEALQRAFSEMKCMDFDTTLNRWTWMYHAEAEDIKFTVSFRDLAQGDNYLILGSFYLPTEHRMYLDVNSFDRTVEALKFFDKHIHRDIASLSHVQIVNTFFEAIPGRIPNWNDFFDRDNPEMPENTSRLDEIADDGSLSRSEKIALAQKEMDETLRKPMKEVESLSIHLYEDGIEAFDAALKTRHLIAGEHWRGNTAFTFLDVFQKMQLGVCPDGE
jgi:hypothetical protein